jgi:hypothetical protein
MFKLWNRNKAVKPVNKHVVNLSFSLCVDSFFDSHFDNLAPVTKKPADFILFHQLSLIPSGEGFSVYHAEQSGVNGFSNIIDANVDVTDILRADFSNDKQFDDYECCVDIDWWNLNLHLGFVGTGAAILIPTTELDNLMLYGKTSFELKNAMVLTDTKVIDVSWQFDDMGNSLASSQIEMCLGEEHFKVHNNAFMLEVSVPKRIII